jgi:membrane-bound ClpP family serine protease
VHGEIWRATSDVRIAAGARIRVTALSGLTVKVEPAAPPQTRGDPR